MNLPIHIIFEKHTEDVPKWLPLVTALGSVVLAFIVGGIVLAFVQQRPDQGWKIFL